MSGLQSKLAGFLLTFSWCLLVGWNVEHVIAEEVDPKPQVVYLHTEFLPYKPDKNNRPTQLGRELARQAFIIACEEELGVAVRDESLDEAIPSDDAGWSSTWSHGRFEPFVLRFVRSIARFGGTVWDNHKVKLGKNARKPTMLSWAKWLPVCGGSRCYLLHLTMIGKDGIDSSTGMK